MDSGHEDLEECNIHLKYSIAESFYKAPFFTSEIFTAYPTFYKAIDKRNGGRQVAIKKICIEHQVEGVPRRIMGEISALKKCEHVNIVKLLDICSSSNALHLVFELMDMDVRGYLMMNGAFKGTDLKNAAFQCFRAVEVCHQNGILHRDLKPRRFLIDCSSKILKLTGFQLARAFQIPLREYSPEVVTLWYRAPEILLGQCKYATPIDIWSLGCICCEMATAEALFPGDSEIDTIFKIFRALGTPSDDVWPGVSSLRDYKEQFPQWKDAQLADVLQKAPSLGANGIAFIRLCLKYNPVERTSARKALAHSFFEGVDWEIMMMDQR